MTDYFTETGSAETVNARVGEGTDPRLATVMAALVRHLHAFIKEVQLTGDEWDVAIEFLTRTGQICSNERQEFILLSDVLGVSMLVDAINNRRTDGGSESTVIGPFYVKGIEYLPMGASISKDGKGEPLFLSGLVTDTAGKPIEGFVFRQTGGV